MKPIELRDLVGFSPDGPVIREAVDLANLRTEVICLEGPQAIGPVTERDSDALVIVVAGEVAVQVDRARSRARQWQVIPVPYGSTLTVRNASEEPAVLLVVVAPPPPARSVEG